jgi:PilZ domain-containing protein
MPERTTLTEKPDERRRLSRITLVGAALFARSHAQRAIIAVVDNVNRLGLGLHAKESLPVQETVTVSIAFLDQHGREQQEKLPGRVAWIKPWEKGFLIGVVWDEPVTKEKNRYLAAYIEESLTATA